MEKSENLARFMIAAVASNSVTCLLHARQEALLRLETNEENSMQSYKNEDKHAIGAAHYKQSERHDRRFEQHSAKMIVYKNMNIDW